MSIKKAKQREKKMRPIYQNVHRLKNHAPSYGFFCLSSSCISTFMISSQMFITFKMNFDTIICTNHTKNRNFFLNLNTGTNKKKSLHSLTHKLWVKQNTHPICKCQILTQFFFLVSFIFFKILWMTTQIYQRNFIWTTSGNRLRLCLLYEWKTKQ